MRVTVALSLTFLVACATASMVVPEAWKSVPEARKIRSMQLGDDGTVRTVGTASLKASAVHVAGGRIMRGDQPLTESFEAIDSFAVSVERSEIVFSARRDKTGFDVGLVSLDGSPISWVPNDPADEVMVSWAPRGNKIAYVIRTGAGDFVRTVHIPTSAQLTNEFLYGRVHGLAWSPSGDKYAIAQSSPEASDRVEVMKYGGEERKVAIAPEAKLDVSVEPFGPETLMIRPASLRYGEKLPVVIWMTDDRFAWDDARAALMRNARVAAVVTAKVPDEALWNRLRALEWIDSNRHWTVQADPQLPQDRYAVRGRVIAAAPSVVKSVAAGFIADQLKGPPPPNGSSR